MTDAIQQITIADIETGPRQRRFDEAWARTIADTLPVLGLENPISVRPNGDGFMLVSGKHRLEAARLAGWETIPAVIRQIGADEAAMHEAFENLMQQELTALARMSHLAAAKAAHDALYPPKKRGRPKVQTIAAKEAQDNLATFAKFRFDQAASQQVGLAARTIRLDISIWEKLIGPIKPRLWGTYLENKQGELQKLSELAGPTQELVIRRLLDPQNPLTTVDDAVAEIEKRERQNADERRAERFARDLAKMDEALVIRVFDANEERVRDYAKAKGWL